jgi:hypothetical protein
VTQNSKLRLVIAMAALNVALLGAESAQVAAEDQQTGNGICGWCTADGLAFKCCQVLQCGGGGSQPACDCHSEQTC